MASVPITLRNRIYRLRGDCAGVVMTEFAVWTSGLLLALMVGLDFGGYYIARGSINEGISAAAVKAFDGRDEVDFDAIPAYVRNMADNQVLDVTVSCNGVSGACTNNENRTCACLRNDATYAEATCGEICTGSNVTENSVAGYYLTIRAAQTYSPVLVPQGMLSGTQMSQATTIRLE